MSATGRVRARVRLLSVMAVVCLTGLVAPTANASSTTSLPFTKDSTLAVCFGSPNSSYHCTATAEGDAYGAGSAAMRTDTGMDGTLPWRDLYSGTALAYTAHHKVGSGGRNLTYSARWTLKDINAASKATLGAAGSGVEIQLRVVNLATYQQWVNGATVPVRAGENKAAVSISLPAPPVGTPIRIETLVRGHAGVTGAAHLLPGAGWMPGSQCNPTYFPIEWWPCVEYPGSPIHVDPNLTAVGSASASFKTTGLAITVTS